MTGLPLGMTDAESYMVIVESVRALAGHQVVTYPQAWTALTGLSAENPDSEDVALMRWVLEELGYERMWVAEFGRSKMRRVWVREPWPNDFRANLNRKITPYVLMG